MLALTITVQERLAVASIARDDPSPLPDMHRDHNAPACTASIVGYDYNAQ